MAGAILFHEQLTTKVELHASCKGLKNKDTFSKSDPILTVSFKGKGGWREIDRTEQIKNNLNPEFAKAINVDYRFEQIQNVRFSVYDVDNDSVTLEDDDFLGSVETTLGQVVSAGNFTQQLLSKNGSAAGPSLFMPKKLFKILNV